MEGLPDAQAATEMAERRAIASARRRLAKRFAHSLAPELLADQIVHTIDQPWGVSISDVTVRASGDGYML